jgi:hypothetical protein
MSWKKYFKSHNVASISPIGSAAMQSNIPSYRNYQSSLPEIYIGHPNRLERYNQYEQMDMDSEVNAALDILAEFSSQPEESSGMPFNIDYKEKPTDTEVEIIKEQLQQWITLNDLKKRIFKIVRNTIKYGDQVFIRDPETFQLYWVEMSKVVKIIVNESKGKEPEQYIVKEVAPNLQNLTVTAVTTSDTYMNHPQVGGPSGSYVQPNAPFAGGSRFSHAQNETAINAEHVVHLSLTEGLDLFWPFGNSVLENIFKVFKQKELLEDAIIIYRVQRAPERRIFYIDVGNMPAHMAMSFVERVKNEIQQRRIPSSTGGGNNVIDASYNPLSASEDYFFPQTAEGRGSKVDTLAGGTNLGEITDLRFFTNKLFRALRIPAAYLPTGIEEASNTVADGKVGTAYIQELRFNKYCERLQNSIVETFDLEFKLWMESNGVNIDPSLFELKFNPPQNFAAYRQSELDTARAATFAQLQEIPHLSKRFAMKRFLGMTQEEITENERMWREEQGGNLKPVLDAGGQMRSVGITPAGTQADLAGQAAEAPEEAPVDTGAEGEAAPAEAPVQ